MDLLKEEKKTTRKKRFEEAYLRKCIKFPQDKEISNERRAKHK